MAVLPLHSSKHNRLGTDRDMMSDETFMKWTAGTIIVGLALLTGGVSLIYGIGQGMATLGGALLTIGLLGAFVITIN